MVSDPTLLYRLRDGVSAPDLLIVAIADLDLFTWLRAHPGADAAAICSELQLAARPVDVMITYLVALGLIHRAGNSLEPTDLACDHLVAGAPHDLRSYYASLRERPGCAELRDVLHSDRPAPWASASGGTDWASRLDEPAFAATITAAMDSRGRFLGPRLADAVADLPARRVLDVGGSSGIYLCALADARPDLRSAVLERPPIDGAARTLLADRGYADRIDVVTADMFTDPLPTGYDLHLLSHVLHDWDQQRVRHLLAAPSNPWRPTGGSWTTTCTSTPPRPGRSPPPSTPCSSCSPHQANAGPSVNSPRCSSSAGSTTSTPDPPPVTDPSSSPTSRPDHLAANQQLRY